MAPKLRHFLSDRRGSVVIVFALMVVVIVGLVGFSIDFSRGLDFKTKMQAALDAAVLAAVIERPDGRDAIARRFFEDNRESDIAAVSSLSFTSNRDGTYTGKATATLPTAFASLVNIPVLNIAVTATARPLAGEPPCINLLDPDKWYGLRLESSSNIKGGECEVHVHSDRRDASAGWKDISAVQFKKMCLKGGTKDRMDNLEQFCQVAPDSYGNALPKVSRSSCNFNDKTFDSKSATLSPGVYCGTTTLSDKVETATFKAGLYIFKGGELVINAKKIVGDEVTFYFGDDSAGLAMDRVVQGTLAAPGSGPYQDILMFQPTGAGGKGARLENVSGQTWTGIIYLPDWDIRIRSADQWDWKANLTANSLEIRSISNWRMAPSEKVGGTDPIGAVLIN